MKGLSYEARAEKSCMLGKISIMQVLLTTDIDPNKIIHMFIDCKDSTKLHNTNDYEEAKKLIESGADVNKKNEWGETPLHLAIFEGKGHQFVKLLLEHGADVNACSNLGRTPLHCALKAGPKADRETVKLLVRYGADLNCQEFYSLRISAHLTQKLYDKGDIILFKFLIKITLLYGFSESYCDTIKSIFSEEASYCYEIAQFSKKCIKEIFQLKAEEVSDNLTWFDIVTSEPEELNLVPVELKEYFPRKYPVYYNIIVKSYRNYLRRVLLFEILKCARMVVVSEITNKEISVDSHCLSMICENLVNNDVANFIKAMFDEQTLNETLELIDSGV